MTTIRLRYDTGAPGITPGVAAVWTSFSGTRAIAGQAEPSTSPLSSTLNPGGTPCARQFITSAADVASMVPLGNTGTFRAVLNGRRSSLIPNGRFRIIVRVVSGDGTTIRGTLVNATAITDLTTTNAWHKFAGTLNPVAVQAGDRLLVEVGAELAAGSSSASVLFAGSAGFPMADYTAPAAGDWPWLELILDDAPQPPTALTQSAASPVAVDIGWTAPAAGVAPTSYEYRVDGGPAVDVGLVTATTITGLAPGTGYTVEVRTVAAAGVSSWSAPLAILTTTPPDPDPRWWTQRLAAALGLDPAGDQPVVEVRTYDHATDTWTLDPDLSNALTGYTITAGRRTATARTEPLTATLGFATARVPATPAIATRLQVALSDAVATALGLTPDQAVRFTGEVTDPTVDHDARRTSLVCVGRLARALRRPADGTSWPVEDDGDRVARILTAVDVQAGTIDAGTVALATPDRLDVAGKLLDQVTASSLGQLFEQPTGDVDWHDAEHRRDTPVHMTLPASSVLRRVSWSQRLDTLVNDLDVKTAAGTVVTVTDPESADPARYGPWPGTADTILTSTLDAYALGVDIVGRRADPSWQLPDLTVDLLRTIPLADLPDALTLRHASLVALTSLPAGCPVPGEVYVEGWTETATPRTWQLQTNVSDPLLSGTGIRWIDWPDTDAYQWQDLNPDLTWFDLARITDPADTL